MTLPSMTSMCTSMASISRLFSSTPPGEGDPGRDLHPLGADDEEPNPLIPVGNVLRVRRRQRPCRPWTAPPAPPRWGCDPKEGAFEVGVVEAILILLGGPHDDVDILRGSGLHGHTAHDGRVAGLGYFDLVEAGCDLWRRSPASMKMVAPSTIPATCSVTAARASANSSFSGTCPPRSQSS